MTMTPIFGKGNFFLKIGSATQEQLPCGSKFFAEIALSSTVFRIQAFLCFAFLKKKLKIQKFKMAAIFGE